MTATVTESPPVHLIDDDESLRTALTRLLEAAGHQVRAYASVGDFLLARRGPLRGCLVLDVRMPSGPSGLELQKALARQGETLPVIFITGHGDIPTGVHAMMDGSFDFLTKQIAAELGCSERTVRAHRSQVMSKMEATSLADLVHLSESLRRMPR